MGGAVWRVAFDTLGESVMRLGVRCFRALMGLVDCHCSFLVFSWMRCLSWNLISQKGQTAPIRDGGPNVAIIRSQDIGGAVID